MATHAGSEGKVFIGSDQVAEIKSWSMEITSDTVDASIIGTSWRKNQATIKGWSGSFDGFWDETDTDGQGALSAGGTVTLNLYPEGDTSGDTYWTGEAQQAARRGSHQSGNLRTSNRAGAGKAQKIQRESRRYYR